MRRMKEKEKGKARAVEKVRKDRACACFRVRFPIRTLLDVNVVYHDLTRYTQRKRRRQSTIRLICTLCQSWLWNLAHGKRCLFIPVFTRPSAVVSRPHSSLGGANVKILISEYLTTSKRRRRNGRETTEVMLNQVCDYKPFLFMLYLSILQNPRSCGNPPLRCHSRYHHPTNRPRPQSHIRQQR